MRVFRSLYERVMAWAEKPRAAGYLALLSFVEAFVFPVPPEVMLAPMALRRPRWAFKFAHLSLACSTVGALVGYALGHYAFQLLMPALDKLHWLAPITRSVGQLSVAMDEHFLGMLGILLVAALQPVVPMKFVTWSAGIVGIPLSAFILCMLVGRAKRVYLLVVLIRWFGPRAEALINRQIERLGWAALAVLALVGLWFLWT